MVSKKGLELLLESCSSYAEPKVMLEQYSTPPSLAAELLNLAYLRGDIEGRCVYDLGCGTGRLAIGAALLGARVVRGFDVDADAIGIASLNAEKLGVNVEWRCMEITALKERCDTVLQNPPFGVQRRGADRPFLSTALKAGKVIYTMHKSSTRHFVRSFIESQGGRVTDLFTVDFKLPRTYSFHRKKIKRIDVDVYRIEKE